MSNYDCNKKITALMIAIVLATIACVYCRMDSATAAGMATIEIPAFISLAYVFIVQ